MILQWLCSGFRVHLKYRKLSKQKQNNGVYQIAADGMMGGHMTNEHLEDPEHHPANGIITFNTRNVIISSDYPSFL